MQIGVPRETWRGEQRVALVPQNAKKLVAVGFSVTVESGAGVAAGFVDEVKGILKAYPSLNAESTSMRCVGYRQILMYLHRSKTVLQQLASKV